MRFSSLDRPRKPVRRLPIAEMKALFQDGRVHVELGKVFSPDGGPHYHINTDDGRRRAMIEVLTMPGGNDLTCRLATKPCWYIPTPGTLVIVAIPSGEIDHCPSVVGILDNGAADEDISAEITLISSELDIVLKAPGVRLGGVDATESAALADSLTGDLSPALSAILVDLEALCTFVGLPAPSSTSYIGTLVSGVAAKKYQSSKVKVAT
jgi:hypothetical protein